MFQEKLTVVGEVAIVITGKDGVVKDSRQIKNLVVTTGKNFIASRLVGTPAVMSHMAVGSGTVAAAAGDTALGSELGRVALESSNVTSSTVTYAAAFPAGVGTGAVTEAGIFNASSSGTMLCRTVFAIVNKGADDAMSITWQVSVS